MSLPNTPITYNPSAQVERMREIIVGRQLARVEQRIDRLEHFAEQPQLSQRDALNRVEVLEARFEAVRDSIQHQVDKVRMEVNGEQANRRQETHRLAEQIQLSAQSRVNAVQSNEIEQRIGIWLGQWQHSLEEHLEQRENWLIQQLRAELQQLRQVVSSQHQEWEAQQFSQQQTQREQLAEIARAAQVLADSTSIFATPSLAKPLPSV